MGREGRGWGAHPPPSLAFSLKPDVPPLQIRLYPLTFLATPSTPSPPSQVGKVDEVFGPINQVMFTVKPDAGITPNGWKLGDKVYIAMDKLLPLSR